jgi:hypothetical protein
MEYKSHRRLLGLPVIHIATGRMEEGGYRSGVATGWIAIGDLACGILLSMGAIAVGGVSVGGIAIGGLAFAGLACGVFSVGGLAVGGAAVGGAAFGWWGAIGGLAVARDFAIGGVAVATHANTPAAQEYLREQSFFRMAEWGLEHALWLALLPAGFAVAQRLWARKQPSSSRDRADGG